jgi:hypothetical protein
VDLKIETVFSFRNVGILLQVHTVLLPRRTSLSVDLVRLDSLVIYAHRSNLFICYLHQEHKTTQFRKGRFSGHIFSIRERMDIFLWNIISGSFTKICQQIQYCYKLENNKATLIESRI